MTPETAVILFSVIKRAKALQWFSIADLATAALIFYDHLERSRGNVPATYLTIHVGPDENLYDGLLAVALAQPGGKTWRARIPMKLLRPNIRSRIKTLAFIRDRFEHQDASKPPVLEPTQESWPQLRAELATALSKREVAHAEQCVLISFSERKRRREQKDLGRTRLAYEIAESPS